MIMSAEKSWMVKKSKTTLKQTRKQKHALQTWKHINKRAAQRVSEMSERGEPELNCRYANANTLREFFSFWRKEGTKEKLNPLNEKRIFHRNELNTPAMPFFHDYLEINRRGFIFREGLRKWSSISFIACMHGALKNETDTETRSLDEMR